MGEEQARADLGADRAEIFVRPGGMDLAVEARRVTLAVPADAETVPIGGGARFGGALGLVDQGVGGGCDEVLEQDRLAPVGQKAAHRASPWRIARIRLRRPPRLTARRTEATPATINKATLAAAILINSAAK